MRERGPVVKKFGCLSIQEILKVIWPSVRPNHRATIVIFNTFQQVWELATWYCTTVWWSIDSYLNRVSADRYPMTLSRAQVSTHGSYVCVWSYPLISFYSRTSTTGHLYQQSLLLAQPTVHTLTLVFPKTSLRRQQSLKGVLNCQKRDLKATTTTTTTTTTRTTTRSKNNWFYDQTNSFGRASRFLVHFLWRPLHDYNVKPSNATFYRGRGHTTKNFPLSIWTWIKPLTINSRKSSLNFTNWAVPNRRDKVWKDANSFVQWCFHCRRRRSSLLKVPTNISTTACFFSDW